jgi:hypothetical protein
MTTNFFSPLSFVAVFPGSEIRVRDPGSEIWVRDPGWVKIRIQDPG